MTWLSSFDKGFINLVFKFKILFDPRNFYFDPRNFILTHANFILTHAPTQPTYPRNLADSMINARLSTLRGALTSRNNDFR